MSDFLPFDRPYIEEDEIAAIADVLRSGWITTGPKTREFEQRFAAYVGARYALALNSGTAALHLALLAAGIGPGDEVITTPLTFCSTVHVITHVGATPVLADVHPDDYNIDPAAVQAAISPRTRAVLPVHLGGVPCRMDELLAIARQQELLIIEDAAHAIGARVGPRMVGSMGAATAFSFYATKNLTTAEGGMLTSDDEALVAEARLLSLHGMSRDAWKRYTAEGAWRYDVVAAGFKYNQTDLQAALGLAQLDKLPHLLNRRAEIHRRYTEAFSAIPGLIPNPTPVAGSQSAHHLYILRLRPELLGIDRDHFFVKLRERGIGASVHFIPVYHFTYYRERYGWQPEDYPITEAIFQSMISLPCYPRMCDEDVERVISAVKEIAKGPKKLECEL